MACFAVCRKLDLQSVTDDPAKYIPRLYGRRQDKPLKPRQARLIDELLPALSIPICDSQIGLNALFPGVKQVEFEVGFGGGEHLVWQAENSSETGFIGAESFVNGVGKLLGMIEARRLENIRVHFGDARPLMEKMPDSSLSRIFVLHPDPWPKRRHFKRRIVSPWFFSEAARLLVSEGELRIASDIPDYVRWTLMHSQNEPAFEWTAESSRDWRIRPEGWPQTRYEAKAIKEGRLPAYLTFRRR